MAYSVDEGPIELWFPHEGPLPEIVKSAFERAANNDPTVWIAAWNSPFERGVTREKLGYTIPYERWLDPQVWARHVSLPSALDKAGRALGLQEGDLKLKTGKKFIAMFSKPHKKRGKKNEASKLVFRDHTTHPEQWQEFATYCKFDVQSERAIYNMIKHPALPKSVRDEWILDQTINDVGVPTNMEFARKCLDIVQRSNEKQMGELKEITKLENPNSRTQILPWFQDRGYPFKSLGKAFVELALKGTAMSPEAVVAMKLRQTCAKTSFKKIVKLNLMVSPDGRLRNQFIFLGAARSGRWSGYGFQFQNQTRPCKAVEKNLEKAMALVNRHDLDEIDLAIKNGEYPSIVDLCTSLIRACFQAPEGKTFVVCDLNAIENRVLGWVAACKAILQVFKDGKCPYLAFGATGIFNIAYDILYALYEAGDAEAKNKRNISKPAVLGAGYGLGSGVKIVDVLPEYIEGMTAEDMTAGITQCYEAVLIRNPHGDMVKTGLLGYAENMGVIMTPEQAYIAHKAFREMYPEVPEYWKRLNRAAIEVINEGQPIRVGCVVFSRWTVNGENALRIRLPSGRYLTYINARTELRTMIGTNGDEYERESIVYDGIGHGVGAIGIGWGPVYTYGGKLTENIVQAIARDILAYGLKLAHEQGMEIVAHVHDEIIVLTNREGLKHDLRDLQWCMSQTPDWAQGLPLHAEGYEGAVYKKG